MEHESDITQCYRTNMIMLRTWYEKLPFKPKRKTSMLGKNSLEPEAFIT